ncbi:MAG TPA: universal stress protein [Gaiellaceae bacterium]|nr:universal stress protein [Gaiellaceae bacterium]
MSGIVVGVDGSKESIAALRFAVEEGALRQTGVLALYALEVPTVPWPGLTGLVGTAREEANRVFGHAIEEAFAGAMPEVPFERKVVEKSPAHALVEAAAEADLLVVGSRGHGGFAGLLLGSVSQQCAHHAPCPVAIIREHVPAERGSVLVGIDGSEDSKEALRWADEEARLRGATLLVLHAWAPGFQVGPGLMPMPLPVETLKADVEAFLDAVVVEVLGEERASEVERRLVETPAAFGLVKAASPRDLIVVGSRGHGGFAGLLLGSVSQQVAHHATCPVVIARRRG